MSIFSIFLIKSDWDRSQNRNALNSKLKGASLGAANTEEKDISAKNWIKKQKKAAKLREQELAMKRQKEMEEQDQAVYDESGL